MAVRGLFRVVSRKEYANGVLDVELESTQVSRDMFAARMELQIHNRDMQPLFAFGTALAVEILQAGADDARVWME
jgi:hypothetical protein